MRGKICVILLLMLLTAGGATGIFGNNKVEILTPSVARCGFDADIG